MSSPVDKIKEKLDIEDVIGSYIKLENAGSNLKAKCPFHNEKTPSFFVSSERGNYYCFGCGAKGDMFTFVQEFEGLDFYGAFKILARKAGVEIVGDRSGDKEEKERLFSVVDQATFFYQSKLKDKKEALDYLTKRGLKKESLEKWRIGYAPDEWRGLASFLKTRSNTTEDMEKAGLIKRKEGSSGENFYDVFRGRVMFPIFDSAERVVGFSGRLLESDQSEESGVNAPKYLNSPETPLFVKSEILHGLNFAKSAIRKNDYAILVEGQMDLVMCHQAGFTNTVASSGTALTTQQLSRIKRLSNNLKIAFDSDGAGFEAAKKSAELALSLGMDVKVASLPKGSDPADLILSDVSKWKEALKNSMHIIDFCLENLFLNISDKRNMGKEIKKEILPYVARIQSSMERAHFVDLISHRAGIKEESVWDDLRDVLENISDQSEGIVSAKNLSEKKPSDRSFSGTEERIIGIMYWQRSLTEPEVDPEEIKKRLSKVLGEDALEKKEESLSSKKESLVFEAEAYYKGKNALEKELGEIFANLERDILKKEFSNEMLKLKEAERQKDSETALESLKKCQELSKMITDLTENT